MKHYLFLLIMSFNQIVFSQNQKITGMEQNIVVKDILKDMLIQNQTTNDFALKQVSATNISMRLNDSTASIGFIYRHMGETIHLFCTFFGEKTSVINSTMGFSDIGQGKTLQESRLLVESGYALLTDIIHKNKNEWWFEEIDTPFFGKINRIRLFAHILYHNSHHAGQISLTLSRGENSK